ncbi:hypothetical protein L211DRAFT_836419 [Terfezia boudieri ATCC MYA-4762]|uniref:Uncharacterized protein n=1 Tax=Terfezia boudieri ATCC MYA-4762 TaxID=1051890 RepID=A0A3N4LRZ1_9PEZI|nr:hypothetical protein L211DRAFT_836419 [Terfezia boudieri ATCC MYA-4762]
MSSKNQPSGSWDEQLQYWTQQLINTRSKLRNLDQEENPDGIDPTSVEKLQNEIEQEIKGISVKLQEAEEGRKNALKKQMEKEAQKGR